jgi:hypothetical protein
MADSSGQAGPHGSGSAAPQELLRARVDQFRSAVSQAALALEGLEDALAQQVRGGGAAAAPSTT